MQGLKILEAVATGILIIIDKNVAKKQEKWNMKQGKMQDLGIELERQNMGKKDYLVNTSQLSMETSVFKYTVLSL